MAIIKILVKTVIQIVGCIIAMFGAAADGLTKLLAKLTNYIDALYNKVDDMFEKKKKDNKKTIDVPL